MRSSLPTYIAVLLSLQMTALAIPLSFHVDELNPLCFVEAVTEGQKVTFQYSIERPHQYQHKTSDQLVTFQITDKTEYSLTKPHFVTENDHKFLYVHKKRDLMSNWGHSCLCFNQRWRSQRYHVVYIGRQ